MGLIELIILLVAIAVLMWLINKYIPMDATIAKILNITVAVIVVIWLLSLFGLLPDLNAIRIGNN